MSIPVRPVPFPDAPIDDAGTPAVVENGWRKAARARGYDLIDRWENPPFPGLLFRNGTSVVATDVVQSTAGANPFTAGSLTAEYVAAGGDVHASFVAIRLPRSMPNIVLVNARRGALHQANIGMGSRQMMRLEGSYDSAFTLYCPIGHERIAADIFTPDLMQVFMDSLPGGDIELFDEWMFVYEEEGRFTSADALNRVERVGLRVQDEIVRRDFASLHEDPVPEQTSSTGATMGGPQFAVVLAFCAVAATLVGVWGFGAY